ncbi:unnamed protein product [Closterium sp. Yama58-4]|nr:unnamed protein product [Closterium sp. Yama58-4]
MHKRDLVAGLPRVLPPLPPSPAPPCLPCVEGRQRAAPHSSSFPPTTAPLQTLHMDVSRLQLSERFRSDFPVLRLHSDRGGEFSSGLLEAFCQQEGIEQSFTLPASPQQNGVAERRIGLVMEVARTSLVHAAAPHFLWSFAVRYAAHQLNLWPRVSLPETSPTLRWTGEAGDASRFRVWGSRAFVRDTSADKLSRRAVPCVFLGFVPDAPGWQFYHATSRRVLASQDVTFDESVPYYRLFPYRTAPLPPRLSSSLQVDPVEPVEVAVDSRPAGGTEPAREESGGAEPGGAEPGGAEPGSAESGGAASGGAASGGAEPGGAEPDRAESGGAEPGGAESRGAEPGGATSGGAVSGEDVATRARTSTSLLPRSSPPFSRSESGTRGAAVFGVVLLVLRTPAVALLLVLRTRGVGATAGAEDPTGGAAAGAEDPSGRLLLVLRTRAWSYCCELRTRCGADVVLRTESVELLLVLRTWTVELLLVLRTLPLVSLLVLETLRWTRPYFVPLLQQVLGQAPPPCPPPSVACPPPVQSQSQLPPDSPLPAPSPYTGPTGGLTERREPESRPASPVRTARTGRRVPRERPPPVPGTHYMTLRPSTAPQRVPLPSPPASSLPTLPDPESDSRRAASPTVTVFATVVTDPTFESSAASALVAELIDFAARCRLDYATSLVAESESESVCPPSVGVAPEGDPDAPDIPTPRTYAEADGVGPYSSQWQTAMDAEMASWKSTGTYVDEVPPPGANIVSGM